MVSCGSNTTFLSHLVECRFPISFGRIAISNLPGICLELFVLFHSNLSKVQVDWLSEAMATTKPAPSLWDETTWQLQLFRLLLFLLLKTRTTNYSARSHFHNCVCFWITACMQLRHGISVSNLLQGAVGKPQVLVKGYTWQYHFGIKSKYLVTPPLLNFNIILPGGHRFPSVGVDAAVMQWSVYWKLWCSNHLPFQIHGENT